MPQVLSLLRQTEANARLTSAHRAAASQGGTGEIHRLLHWPAVLTSLTQLPGTIAVVDPYFSGGFDLHEIQRILDVRATGDIVVYGDFRGRPVGRHVAGLLAIGIRRIVTFDVDDSRKELKDHLIDAVGSRRLMRAVQASQHVLSPQQQVFLGWAVRRGHRNVSVADLACEFHVSSRSVRRWFNDLSGIGPCRLLSWVRVLHAGRLISSSSLPLARVAAHLQFSTASDLSRRFHSLVGRRISSMRRDEVFDVVTRRFVSTLEAAARSGRLP